MKQYYQFYLITGCLLIFILGSGSGMSWGAVSGTINHQQRHPGRWLAGASTINHQPSSLPLTYRAMEVFGYSAKGRPLKAYILGDGPDVTMIFGGFHGNERPTPGLVEALYLYLKEHPQELFGRRVILIPRTNPDGIRANTRTNGHGVDINRNFPGSWKAGSGTSRSNPGPLPASEPETQSIIQLLNRYRPVKVISIHSPLHCLIGTGEKGVALGRQMQRSNGYRFTDDVGYPTPGSFGHYCGKNLGIAIVTLELPPVSVRTAWEQNRNALLAAIEYPTGE